MKLAFINIPLQNLDFPPAAAALLTSIVEKKLNSLGIEYDALRQNEKHTIAGTKFILEA